MSDVKGRAREALTGITEGQWEINQEGWAMISAGSDSVIHGYVDTTCEDCGNDVAGDAFVACSYEDRALIAAAPSLISDLLSLVEELEQALDRVRAVCTDPGGPDSWSHTFQGRASVFVDDIIYALDSEEFL